MTRLQLGLTCGLLAVTLSPRASAADPPQRVTVESLLDRLVDPHWIVAPPAPGERAIQFSSYDRATRLEAGRIVSPFANGDRGHYLRIDRSSTGDEYVLAESEGPGYISRIWSANPDGLLRIYVDGQASPALEADFARLTNGEIPPFLAPFAHDASRGRNFYVPIPFARSIKVVTTTGDQYYQVNVTQLPPGTDVESYSPDVLHRATPRLQSTALALLDPERGRPADPRPINLTIAPRTTATLLSLDGPGCIDWLRLKATAPDLEIPLARSLLTLSFDGQDTPQVAAPLGDFFGSGPGVNPFQTAMTSVAPDGAMTCRWPMPFGRQAVIRLTNGTDQPLTLQGEVGLGQARPGPYLLFHARWRQQDGLQTVEADGTLDWPALRVAGGPGRFVGLLLNVFNPTGAWWGEGDEKVYLDGEPFPSTFGTGTEDYFGYAWCDPTPYENPFHAQTRCDGPANRGNTSNLRWHILDAMAWRDSIRFDLEVWHWQSVSMQYATLAFFYAAPNVRTDASLPQLDQRVIHRADEGLFREPGVFEAENLTVRSVSQGQVSDQDMLPFGDNWSAGAQLWWVCREPQGELRLELPVEKAGSYRIDAGFTRAPDYGVAELTLNGSPLGQPIDLHAPRVVHAGPVSLGRTELRPGPNVLVVRVPRKSPASSGYLFGLDWIRLIPEP